MIDTSGTRHRLQDWSEDVWVFDGWQDFLQTNNLLDLEQFLELCGEVVDLNTRSVVHRLQIGDSGKVFYLKIHKNYLRRDYTTGFKKVPVAQIELANMMHYARAGFDYLSPVAWGWRPSKEGGDGFLLLEELNDYLSLQQWLEKPEAKQKALRKKISFAVADAVARIHEHGLAHVDLFSWHIFLKQEGEGFVVQPLDLERSEVKGSWPGSGLMLHLKQLRDLATLHLSVYWPLVSDSERLRFFLRYQGHQRLNQKDRKMIYKILKKAASIGKRKKFRFFGVSARIFS